MGSLKGIRQEQDESKGDGGDQAGIIAQGQAINEISGRTCGTSLGKILHRFIGIGSHISGIKMVRIYSVTTPISNPPQSPIRLQTNASETVDLWVPP